jgi:hypothetical protein
LYTKLVFFGQYWLVFLGIYHTDTNGTLGRYQNVAGNPFFLERGAMGPFFPQKGGNDPLFEEPSPLFEGKGRNDTSEASGSSKTVDENFHLEHIWQKKRKLTKVAFFSHKGKPAKSGKKA